MFSTKTIALIQATVPLLKARGEEVTRHFYRTMLDEHPELKVFFNEAHQAQGTQARALAGAVLAYASHIDRLEALAPALPRIIQKHAALGVQPEHYPIVGGVLLRAIGHVLGEVATDEIIADDWDNLAWNSFGADEPAFIARLPAPTFPRPDAAELSKHPWGTSSAQMAYILFQAPAMVAVHASEMLNMVDETESGGPHA